MNPIGLFSFGLIIVCLFANLYILLTQKPPVYLSDSFKKWQILTFVFAASILFFVIFYVSALGTINAQQVVTDSSGDTLIITSNEFIQNITYLNLSIGIEGLNLLVWLALMLMEFRVFGRGKFKPNTW